MTKKIIQNILSPDHGVMASDKEMEEAVLSVLLSEPKTAKLYLPRIQEMYFYDTANLLIFRSILHLYQADKPIDILTVTEQLSKDGTLEEAGGPYQVTVISSKVASSAHIEYHILVLQQLYMRRKMREIMLTFDRQAADMTVDIEDTLVDAQRALESLAENHPSTNDLREMPEVMDKVMQNLRKRMEQVDGGLIGTDTGSKGLNELILGWQPGTLNIIAARPGEGKTAFLMHTLLTAAREGKKVCLISLESSAEKLAERWMLASTQIAADDWNRGRITPEQWEEAHRVSEELKLLHIVTFDRGNISVEQICSVAKSLHVQGRCDVLGLDYLQLLANRHTNGIREQEVAHNSRLLKLLSMKLEIPIIALSQLNREVKTNQYQIPKLENLRESGSIEQDGDTVGLLFHPHKTQLQTVPETHYPVTPNLLMLIIEKNRNGRTGTVYLSHNESMTQFAEYEPPQDWIKEQLPTASETGSKDWRESSPSYQNYRKQKENAPNKRLFD